jgi:SAM-dependent methyltransferase
MRSSGDGATPGIRRAARRSPDGLSSAARVSTCNQVSSSPTPHRRFLVRHAAPLARCMSSQARQLTVLDLCCGTGAIGLALADQWPTLDLYTADIDPAAVAYARHYLEGIGRVFRSDRFRGLPNKDVAAPLSLQLAAFSATSTSALTASGQPSGLRLRERHPSRRSSRSLRSASYRSDITTALAHSSPALWLDDVVVASRGNQLPCPLDPFRGARRRASRLLAVAIAGIFCRDSFAGLSASGRTTRSGSCQHCIAQRTLTDRVH